MSSESGAKKKKTRFIKAKCYIVMSVLVQIFRIFGVGITFYNEIDIVILKNMALNFLGPTGDPQILEPKEENASLDVDTVPVLTALEERLDEIDAEESNQWEDRTFISLPCMEIVVSWILIYFIIGPLSKQYSYAQWIKWITRMRIFWMRLVWTLTAVFYSIIVVQYRKEMFNFTNKAKYVRTTEWYLLISFICMEYFTLGVLECIIKIMSSETLLLKLQKSSLKLPQMWKKLYILSYHAGMFAYMARNFSMSLYFALLSAFVAEDKNAINPFSGLTLVLQVYLAIIRGRFYGFFMHVFLSPFLLEEDDDVFKKVKKGTNCSKKNADETEKLSSKKHAENSEDSNV